MYSATSTRKSLIFKKHVLEKPVVTDFIIFWMTSGSVSNTPVVCRQNCRYMYSCYFLFSEVSPLSPCLAHLASRNPSFPVLITHLVASPCSSKTTYLRAWMRRCWLARRLWRPWTLRCPRARLTRSSPTPPTTRWARCHARRTPLFHWPTTTTTITTTTTKTRSTRTSWTTSPRRPSPWCPGRTTGPAEEAAVAAEGSSPPPPPIRTHTCTAWVTSPTRLWAWTRLSPITGSYRAITEGVNAAQDSLTPDSPASMTRTQTQGSWRLSRSASSSGGSSWGWPRRTWAALWLISKSPAWDHWAKVQFVDSSR